LIHVRQTGHALSRRQQRTLRAFAAVVCPPQPSLDTLWPDLLAGVQQFLEATAPGTRSLLLVSFTVFDEAARLTSEGRGRRFADLDRLRAEAYYRRRATGSRRTQTLVTLMKGVLTLHYYGLPQIEEALGYRPAAYVRATAARRTERYGEQIRQGERLALLDDRGTTG
jgi:hypothetical protein